MDDEIRDVFLGFEPFTEEQLAEQKKKQEEALLQQQKMPGPGKQPQQLPGDGTSPQNRPETDAEERAAGGPGSGNFGHEGRPGQQGGSSATEGSMSAKLDDVMGGQKIAGAKGSNAGGVYKSKSGDKYYVKRYSDERQAYGEHVANELYHAVGVGAPKSVVGEKGGDTLYASEWMADAEGTLGQVGLSREVSNKILDGYVVDAFTGNWDAVGTGHDNIMVMKDGSVNRVDNGGTFLHRAQGGMKPESLLSDVGELDTLSNPKVNSYYAAVFKSAGIRTVDDMKDRAAAQIKDILAAKQKFGSWKNFVDQKAPSAPKAYREKLAKVLEDRTASLEKQLPRFESKARALGGEGSGNFGHGGRPGQVGGSAPSGNEPPDTPETKEQAWERIKAQQDAVLAKAGIKPISVPYAPKPLPELKDAKVSLSSRRLSARQEEAVRGWVGSPDEASLAMGSEEMNSALRRGEEPAGAKDLRRAIEGSVVQKDTTLYRGVSDELAVRLSEGSSFTDKGFTSLTKYGERAARFTQGAGTVFEVRVPKGTKMLDVSKALKREKGNWDDEGEHLLKDGTKFKVISRGDRNILEILK